MTKTKDVIYVELYDRQEVEIVTAWLTAKMRRVTDRQRKAKDNVEHLRKIMERKCL